METNRDAPGKAAPFFNPLTGWESASRFQAATFDWMARAFQQWLALVTTVPPHFVLPPLVQPHGEAAPPTPLVPMAAVRNARPSSEGRPVAKAEPKRPARKARAKSAAKPRARG